MWEAIDLRELRVFLVLADELHFGRTAERLGLTPSRVSQSLRELEQKLGAQLVHRTSRRVRLTPFGEAFVVEAQPAHDQLSKVLERTAAAASGLQGTLRLGMFSRAAGGDQLLALAAAFEKAHPGSEVDVVQLSWDDPFAQLRAGEVELMASWLPLKEPDLAIGPSLAQYQRVLAVGRDHPFADREELSAEELADQPIARFDGWPRELRDAWTPPKTPNGQRIAAVRMPAGERTPLGIAIRIARGELVHLTATDAGPFAESPDIANIPVKGLPPLRSALVWRRRQADPKTRAFIRVARETLRKGTKAGR